MFVDLKHSPPPDETGEIPIEVSQVAYRNSFVLRIALPYPLLERLFDGKLPEYPRVSVQFGFGTHHGRVRIGVADEGDGYAVVGGNRRVPLAQVARRPDYVINEPFQPAQATDIEISAGAIFLTLPKVAFAAQPQFEEATDAA